MDNYSDHSPITDAQIVVLILSLVFAFLLAGGILLFVFSDHTEYTTRICSNWYGGNVCNDYPGILEPKANGCTEITITGADSEICGNYTLEHRKKN